MKSFIIANIFLILVMVWAVRSVYKIIFKGEEETK